jgi:TetR/AcrR family transcriptional repressor of nem operon
MGNKRQFEEEVVLDQLAKHFWRHGYSATKVDQLSAVTGLTKTSLYNAFGNKDALFLKSMNFYVENSLKEMSSYLNIDNSLSTNLEKLFRDSFQSIDVNTLSYGCFLTNSIVELNGNKNHLHEHITNLFDQIRGVSLEFFSHYIDTNKLIGTFDAQELTDYYLAFWQGLRVQSRNHDASTKIENSINLFLKFIKSIEK